MCDIRPVSGGGRADLMEQVKLGEWEYLKKTVKGKFNPAHSPTSQEASLNPLFVGAKQWFVCMNIGYIHLLSGRWVFCHRLFAGHKPMADPQYFLANYKILRT